MLRLPTCSQASSLLIRVCSRFAPLRGVACMTGIRTGDYRKGNKDEPEIGYLFYVPVYRISVLNLFLIYFNFSNKIQTYVPLGGYVFITSRV